MSYGRMEKILKLGETYRVQELADFIGGTDAYLIAEEICKILLICKADTTPFMWRHIKETLLSSASDAQFDMLVEGQEEDESS